MLPVAASSVVLRIVCSFVMCMPNLVEERTLDIVIVLDALAAVLLVCLF